MSSNGRHNTEPESCNWIVFIYFIEFGYVLFLIFSCFTIFLSAEFIAEVGEDLLGGAIADA